MLILILFEGGAAKEKSMVLSKMEKENPGGFQMMLHRQGSKDERTSDIRLVEGVLL